MVNTLKLFVLHVEIICPDYDCKFIVAEVGCQGRINDGCVYRNSEFNYALQPKTLNLPEPMKLTKTNDPFWISQDVDDCTPMVFVANNSFPRTTHSMQPYEGKHRLATSF